MIFCPSYKYTPVLSSLTRPGVQSTRPPSGPPLRGAGRVKGARFTHDLLNPAAEGVEFGGLGCNIRVVPGTHFDEPVPGVVDIDERPIVDHVSGVVVARGCAASPEILAHHHVVPRVVDVVVATCTNVPMGLLHPTQMPNPMGADKQLRMLITQL